MEQRMAYNSEEYITMCFSYQNDYWMSLASSLEQILSILAT
jgi:hypothetical protein